MKWQQQKRRKQAAAFAAGLKANVARAKRGTKTPSEGESPQRPDDGFEGDLASSNTGARASPAATTPARRTKTPTTPAQTGTWVEERATPAPCSSCGELVQMRVRIGEGHPPRWGLPLCVPCARKARKGSLPAECNAQGPREPTTPAQG